MPRPEDDPRLRLEFWKAMQERQAQPSEKPNFDRFAALELTRNQALGYLFQLMLRRPAHLQGSIRSFSGLELPPTGGMMSAVGVGAFIQMYVDEVTGYNDQFREFNIFLIDLISITHRRSIPQIY